LKADYHNDRNTYWSMKEHAVTRHKLYKKKKNNENMNNVPHCDY